MDNVIYQPILADGMDKLRQQIPWLQYGFIISRSSVTEGG